MLIFKGLPGGSQPYVTIGKFNEPTITLLKLLDSYEKPIYITAIDNGVHSVGTLHHLSLAWDFGLEAELSKLYKWLLKRLPPPYEIINETTHIHVEWDTHK